jgi:uncharacterized glyoxalase superfamily protein PhnB
MSATSLITCLKYNDAKTAIDWLCNAFGFEKHLVIPNDEGQIAHAQLKFGLIMIMIGSTEVETEFGKLIKNPNQVGGFETQSPYIVVDNVDEIYEKAKSQGATIAIEIKTEDYGGRGFSCYDLEGHLWNFGTYDPWKE